MKWRNDPHNVRTNNLVCGGLLAISLIILQDFIQLGVASQFAFIAVVSFAVAFPCLVGVLLSNNHEAKYPYMHHAKFFNCIYFVGILSGFIGVLATFWYLSWIAAAVFFGVAIGAFALYLAHYRQLSEDKEGLKKAP
jgi:hypothetical protein